MANIEANNGLLVVTGLHSTEPSLVGFNQACMKNASIWISRLFLPKQNISPNRSYTVSDVLNAIHHADIGGNVPKQQFSSA